MKRTWRVELARTLAASLAAAVIIYTITRSAQTFQKKCPAALIQLDMILKVFFFSAFIY